MLVLMSNVLYRYFYVRDTNEQLSMKWIFRCVLYYNITIERPIGMGRMGGGGS